MMRTIARCLMSLCHDVIVTIWGNLQETFRFNRFLQVTLCRNLEAHEKCCTFAISN